MALRSELEAVMTGVASALEEPYAKHPLAQRVRGSLADEIRALIADDSYKTQGSAGSGGWAETIWAAVFDRLITETAMEGFYPVYLFRRDGAGVYLSLNQGTTTVLNQFGRGQYLDVLRKAATQDVARLDRATLAGLITGPLDLPGEGDMTRGYAAGNLLALYYEAGAVPDDTVLAEQLARFIQIYADVAEGRNEAAGDSDEPEASRKGTEAVRYRWHRSAERSSDLAKKAKKHHGYRCQACGVLLEDIYGPVAKKYIEAHHLAPFAALEGRPTELDAEKDFAVVCANCHRMLHKGPPYTIAELKTMLADRRGA